MTSPPTVKRLQYEALVALLTLLKAAELAHDRLTEARVTIAVSAMLGLAPEFVPPPEPEPATITGLGPVNKR